MPTYEYTCPAGHIFEKFLKINQRPRLRCPECGQPAERKISGGAGLLFKGSGFYITDYGKDGKGPRAKPRDSAESGGAKDSAAAPSSQVQSSSDKPSSSTPKKSGSSE